MSFQQVAFLLFFKDNDSATLVRYGTKTKKFRIRFLSMFGNFRILRPTVNWVTSRLSNAATAALPTLKFINKIRGEKRKYAILNVAELSLLFSLNQFMKQTFNFLLIFKILVLISSPFHFSYRVHLIQVNSKSLELFTQLHIHFTTIEKCDLPLCCLGVTQYLVTLVVDDLNILRA